MRKKMVAWVLTLVLVFLACGSALGITVAKMIETNKQEEALKAENEKAFIYDLFHDQGHIYMTPDEPKTGEKVTLRLRTLRYNVTRAQIQYTTDKGASWHTADMEFEKQDDTGYYDIWKGEILAGEELIYYRFTAGNKDLLNTVYYDAKGVDTSEKEYTSCWKIMPNHDVPEWAKGALWYSLMPDAFYNGNTTNDKQISGENTYVTWNQLHKGLADKYGGDLAGIENKLDYIESLNVDAIYMNPVFKSYQNAGYGPVHYDEVESSFGNEEDLESLSKAIRERDLKLMGDVVLTFTLENSYYLNKDGRWPVTGAYQSEDSEYNKIYKFYNWPDNYMMTDWAGPATDLNTSATKNLFYASKDSYLLKYANLFDGYRFDCGGWLWGTTNTDDVETATFVKEIREALRKVDNDFYMLAESDWENMNTGTWDSSWNVNYMPKLQDYAKGLINETLMTEAMYTYEKTIPRNVALCLQNMMCDHDSYRVVQHDDYMYNAAVLLQMTYLGSPSIYYGEEMDYIRENESGIGDVKSFYAFDWDESNWDYSRLNFYKATTELRKEYSCVKTGVVNILDSSDDNNTITFGRWDENGAAITVTSQNEDMITVEIPVNKCDIKDGTVMTDWYTGAQYIVEDGRITANIIPGGTVIVTGKQSSSYRQTFEQTIIGNASAKNSILTENAVSYIIEGKGKISDKTDKLTFVNNVAYDSFSVFANMRGSGSSTLMIRNGAEKDDVYYAVVVDNNKLSVLARTSAGESAKTLVKMNCTKNTYVKLVRNGQNEFTVYKTEVQDGNLGTWELIEKSKVSINMNNKVLYGFAPIKGEKRVNNLTFEQLEDAATFDTFDNKVSAALFDNINEDFVSVKDGKLTISNSKKDKSNYLLTNSMEDDWTFKTRMNYKPAKEGYAGIVSYQDENNYVVVGYKQIEGQDALFIGKHVNGELAVYGSVDVAQKDVIIQLQRAGAYYSAVYSVDDGTTWNYVGRLYANLSSERVGILVDDDSKASFDWVSFGDSINDGVSVNTPHSPVPVDTTYANVGVEDECKYEYLTGDWSVVTGGWKQSDSKKFAQAAATNKEFYGLYIEATVDITSGDGFAGLAFGKTSPSTGANDGFVLKYYNDGNLVLTYKGKEIAKEQIKVDKNNASRLVVEALDGNIMIYAGQKVKPVMKLDNTEYRKGYVSFCTDGVTAEFRNFYHGSTNATWNWVSGNGYGSGNVLSTVDSSTTERQIHTVGTLSGYAFTNFICSAKLSVAKANENLDSASGILLCASEGKSASSDGVFVYLDGKGQLVLSVDGKEQGTYDIQGNGVSAEIMVVKQNGVYKVFLKGVQESVLEYSEKFNRGGVFSLYSINANGAFADVAIENLQTNQKYEESRVAKQWNEVKSKSFSDNFSSLASSENYYFYNEEGGIFEVADGVLKCHDSNDWIAGATVTNDIYTDFTMEFKLRIDSEQPGWMSVGMRKSRVNGDHNNSGLSLMISANGEIFFYDSNSHKNSSATNINSMSVGEWNNIKIVAKGSQITAYVNGVKKATYSDDKFFGGFINFTSGMHDFSIDDLKITPIN